MENKNEMMVFDMKKLTKIRIITIEGKDWFIGKDVADALGYKNLSDALNKHVDDEDKMQIKKIYLKEHDDIGTKGAIVINESGLYQLIVKSKTITKKQKEDSINFFKKFGMLNDVTLHSRKEIEFIDKLERALLAFDVTGKKQHKVLNYKIDYYIPSLNVAIEYDENGHKYYTYEAHELRQELIQKELGCRFIRVTDEKNDEFNIGLVIKELFNTVCLLSWGSLY